MRRLTTGWTRIDRALGFTDRFSQMIRMDFRKLSEFEKLWKSIRSRMLATHWTIGVDKTLDLINGLICKSHMIVI